MEQWKEIIGYEGLYEISNLGNVRSVDRIVESKGRKVNRKGKTIKLDVKPNGYAGARLCKNGKAVSHLVHRLVAIHFIPNPDDKPVVNHKNGVKTDNFSDNLEWSTQLENIQHAEATGLRNEEQRIANVKKARTKITPEQKQWIKDNYIPRDSEFGTKALAEKFGISKIYISIIANSK